MGEKARGAGVCVRVGALWSVMQQVPSVRVAPRTPLLSKTLSGFQRSVRVPVLPAPEA